MANEIKMTKEELISKAVVIEGFALINATPHPLNIVQRDGSILTIAPSGAIPRCKSTEEVYGTLGLIDITQQTLGEVENLPEEIPGAYYIVSRLVASAAKRDDLLVPGTLDRDDEGKVIG